MNIKRFLPLAILLGVGAQLAMTSASASDMVYTPNNPSFGGSSFNSAHLLGIAGAQKPDKPAVERPGTSQSEIFLRQLQSRLLSSLAGQVTDSIFGENQQDQGTISFGNQIVNFERGLDSVLLTVVDLSAGTTTEIEIPLLQTQ
jgi:curli production assembly/transport component CsgF